LEEYDLLQCIDRGMERFGSYLKQTIYWRMTILYGSQREAVITNPEIFAKTIEEISDGSSVKIERSIIREIRKVFDLPVQDSETLCGAIAAARKQVVLVCS